MEIEALQKQIDEISVFLYQNREQEAFGKIGELLGNLKKVTDALLCMDSGNEQEIGLFISNMYQSINCAYKYKDVLGMADCLQDYAMLATDLYKKGC